MRRSNRQAGSRDSGRHGTSIPSDTPRNAIRGAGTLIGGTVIGQVLLLAAAPILTRVYDPADFGTLAVFTSLLSLLTVVAAGRYELAIPLPKEDREAGVVLFIAFILALATSITCALLVMLFSDRIASMLGSIGMGAYLWLLPLGIICVTSFSILETMAIRMHAFLPIAKSKVGQTLGTIGVQLGGSPFGSPALIAGFVAGQTVGIISLSNISRKSVSLRGLSWQEIKGVAKRYKNFPLYSTWTALLNTASLQFAPIFLAGLFGVAAVGLYALTLRVLALPASVIGNSLASVFLSRAPEAHRQGRLTDVVKRMHVTLATAGAPALVLVLVAGPDLFAIVFGEVWRDAGRYAQWMAPWMYLQFQWSPLSMLSVVLELQRAALVAQVTGFVIRVGTLLACSKIGLSADASVACFAVASAITYACIQTWFLRRAGVTLRETTSHNAGAITKFGLLCSPAIFLYTAVGGVLAISCAATWFVLVAAAWYFRLRKSILGAK